MKTIDIKSIKGAMENIYCYAKQVFDDEEEIEEYAKDNINGIEFETYIPEGFKEEVQETYEKIKNDNVEVSFTELIDKDTLSSEDFAKYIVFNGVDADYGFNYSYKEFLYDQIWNGIMNTVMNR